MKKVELRNKGNKIGNAFINKKNVKKLKNKNIKWFTGSLLLAGIAISAIVSKQKEPEKDVDKNVAIEEEIEQEESLITNDLFRADLFKIDRTEKDGTILFVSSDYLYDNGYIPIDTVKSRYDFIVDFNDDLVHNPDKYEDKDLSDYTKKYNFFRAVYKEHTDGDQKESLAQQEYLLELEDDLIKTIYKLGSFSYIPEAVESDEYLETVMPEKNDKYTVDYTIPKDMTLSELLSYTDNSEEYQKAMDEILANPANNIDDKDLIYAGENVELPYLDKGDVADLGYTLDFYPADEVEQRMKWINEEIDNIDILSGDTLSKENLSNLKKSVEILRDLYDEYKVTGKVSDELLYSSREVGDKVYLLTGHQFEMKPVKDKSR